MKEMRTNIIRIGICIGKAFLNILYFFMKMFPTKNKVLMLSRQADKPGIDFKYIRSEILRRNDNVEIVILCKILRKTAKERLKYCSYIIKCMYHIATAKVCILDGYSIPVSILKHKKKLTIIQIWHASGAIKKFGYQSINKKEGRGIQIAKIMRMHKNYNFVVAPSNATAEFYKEAFGIEQDKIVIMGLPRLDYILGDNKSQKRTKSFYLDYPQSTEKEIILYVPTFRKDKEDSDKINQLINSVDFSRYKLIIKLHPLDKTPSAMEYTVNKKYNTFDLLRIADYIITDYSAVAFEAAILDKPVYFYVHDIDEYKKARGLNIQLFKEMNNNTSKNVKEIMISIENKTYDFEELSEFKLKYMGNNYYNNTSKLVDFILKYLDKDVDNERFKENEEKNKENGEKIKENEEKIQKNEVQKV